MLADRILESDTLTRNGDRVSVSVRIPWYRALPLSSITDVRLDIDGQDVPTSSLTWTVNGQSHRLDELPPLHDDWWFVLDSAVLEGDLPVLSVAPMHDVHVQVGLFIPYLPAGGGVLAIAEQDRKLMLLRENTRPIEELS